MDIASTTTILVGGICLVLGFIASLLISSSREDEPLDDLQEEAPPGGRKGRYASILRLWREKKSGAMLIEVQGKTFIGPNALTEDQRTQLEQAARDLRTWLGMGLSVAPLNRPNFIQDAAPALVSMEDTASVQYTERINQAVAPVSQSSSRLVTGSVTRTPETGKVPVPDVTIPQVEKSIVMQIEDILQDLIAGSSYERLGVHLIEDSFKGVIVSVGNERFEGIDSVTDPEVKKLLRSAVRAWEQR